MENCRNTPLYNYLNNVLARYIIRTPLSRVLY